MALSAVSLFSGAGGMDIGVLKADFNVLACIEMDRHCCASLHENAKRQGRQTKIFEGDIRSISPSALLDDLSLKKGQLDLLFGGPPCQAFSQIGKQKALMDERGLLLFQMVRFAREMMPQAIMIEQVKGLLTARDLKGRKGGVFRDFLSSLEGLGYAVVWKVILAADYGVPQMRQRIFMVAVRERMKFSFPPPTNSGIDRLGLIGLPAYRVVGDALLGLGEPIQKADTCVIPDDSHYDVTPARDRERIHGVPEGGHLSSQAHLPASQIRGLTRKDTTKFLRVDRKKPANTLRGGEIFYHPVEDRYLTPREYMRIHGYPDSYVLRGPVRGRTGTVRDLDQHRQVGNSVPPPVAEAIALKLRDAI